MRLRKSIKGLLLGALCCSMNMACSSGGNAKEETQKPTEPKYYTESESKLEANKASQELGVVIDVDAEKDFQNEYKYNRILQILKRNKAVIAPNVNEIERIILSSSGSYINTQFAINNKAIVQISIYASESDIVSFFKEGLAKRKKELVILTELRSAIGLNLVDHEGINSDNYIKIKEKLVLLSQDINFSQDLTFKTLELGKSFLITNEGMVIDIYNDYAVILSNVKEAIEMRLRLQRDVSPLLAKTGLSLNLQAGTFTPFEMSQVIQFITDNSTLIQAFIGDFKTVLVGKRWDFNLATGTILIDYKSDKEIIKSKLTSLNIKNDELSFDPVKSSLKETLATLGLNLQDIQIDLSKNSNSLLNLKNSVYALTTTSFVNYAKEMGVKVLNLNSQETRFVLGTKVLFVKVPVEINFEESLRKQLLTNRFLQLNAEVKQLAISKQITLVLDETSQSESAYQDLQSIKIFFTEHLTTDLISKVKLKTITTSRAQGSLTKFKDGQLDISYLDFEPAKAKDILKSYITENTPVIP